MMMGDLTFSEFLFAGFANKGHLQFISLGLQFNRVHFPHRVGGFFHRPSSVYLFTTEQHLHVYSGIFLMPRLPCRLINPRHWDLVYDPNARDSFDFQIRWR